jgi:dihydrofolate reductase
MLSLDGCYADETGDMSFAHRDDAETKAFMAENAKGGGMLLFGRVTYEMMLQYWPTPLAAKNDPVVARQMNDLPKLVFSKTLKETNWKNTRLVKGDLGREVRKLKAEGSLDMAVLGSGSLVAALASQNLIDEYQLLINPVILGGGKRLFAGVAERPDLKLEKTRTFKNGNVFVSYSSRQS